MFNLLQVPFLFFLTPFDELKLNHLIFLKLDLYLLVLRLNVHCNQQEEVLRRLPFLKVSLLLLYLKYR